MVGCLVDLLQSTQRREQGRRKTCFTINYTLPSRPFLPVARNAKERTHARWGVNCKLDRRKVAHTAAVHTTAVSGRTLLRTRWGRRAYIRALLFFPLPRGAAGRPRMGWVTSHECARTAPRRPWQERTKRRTRCGTNIGRKSPSPSPFLLLL